MDVEKLIDRLKKIRPIFQAIADIEARLVWNTRAPILSDSDLIKARESKSKKELKKVIYELKEEMDLKKYDVTEMEMLEGMK